MDGTVSIDTVLWLLGILFPLIIGIFTFLIKLLLRTNRDKIQSEINNLQEKTVRLEGIGEKLRDQWADFQKTASTVELDRGRRVDALFVVVDGLKDGFGDLKLALANKIEEQIERECETLELKLQNYVKTVKDN